MFLFSGASKPECTELMLSVSSGMCFMCVCVRFPILLQKLRNKGHSDCASPEPDDCFGHSPFVDDRSGKDSDVMFTRCAVSTVSPRARFVLIGSSMLMSTTGAKQERAQRLR